MKLSTILKPKGLDPKTIIVVLTAFIVSLVAVLTPDWMVAELVEQKLKIMQGLWLSCNTKINTSIVCATLFGHSHYKEDFDDHLQILHLPHNAWHTVVLVLIVLSLLCALAALTLFWLVRSATANPRRQLLIQFLFVISVFAAGVLNITACIVYAFIASSNAMEISDDSLHHPHNVWKGASFYAAAIASFIYLITTAIVIAWLLKQRNSDVQEGNRVNFDPKLANEPPSSNRVTPRRKKTPYPLRYSIA